MNGGPPDAPDRASLTTALVRADRAALAAFVRENVSRLSESDVLRCLRHPYSGEAVVAEVLAAPGLLSSREVRKAVALHPAAPRAEALRLLEDLPWRDLVDVGREARTPAPVRSSANRRILEKLPKLSLGEKAALARIADRALVGPLLDDGEVDVMAALLSNPRLVEEDLTAWLLVRHPKEGSLVHLASNERWMARTAVRTAVLLSPRTPRAISLSLLRASVRSVLERLSMDPSADPLLAACARTLLESPVSRAD